MKRNLHTLTLLLLAAALLAACTDMLLDDGGDNRRVAEGLPATLRIGVQAAQGIEVTRAAADPAQEEAVGSLFVLIFDEDGNKRLGLPLTGSSDEDGNQLHTDSQGRQYAVVNTTSMNNATVVCIANATESGYAITTEHLMRIRNLGDLQNVYETLSDPSVERVNNFLMTATATQAGSTQIAIEAGPNNLQAELQRVDAKVTFDIGLGHNSGWQEASFLPRQWRVCQVPLNTLLMPRADGTDYDTDEAGDYFHTELMPIETIGRDNATQRYTGGSFTFYMPENLKQPLQPVSDYAQRDAWQGHDDEGFKRFTNAHPHSTYVEVTGTLTYRTQEQTMVSADVRLTIHLGHDSHTDVNNYQTRRNHHYTYTVTIEGIDNIVVEVNDGIEGRPGYEGDVVMNTEQIFELDSHYDRCLMSISPDQIGPGMTWSVRTPFSTGTHDCDNDHGVVEAGLEDYRWMKFAFNAAQGAGFNEFARYPGDGYEHYHPDVTDPAQLHADDLMDINQLTHYLIHAKEQGTLSDLTMTDPDGGGEPVVRITAYVDEYLYHEHPQQPDLSEAEKLLLWKQSVDREDRQMHLIIPLDDAGNGGNYSPDGQSSVIRSLYSFNQRSIRTIYDAGNGSLTTAWGLESVMEADDPKNGGRLPVGAFPRDAIGQTTTDNGRANTLLWTVGKRWSDIVRTSPRYGLNTDYENALYACMLRNRDLNGDDIVQAEEVRWYLASIDQLTDIYIGEEALDQTSRLYPRNATDRPNGNSVYWHYTSSSYNNSSSADENGPWVLWAEEGASRGSYKDSQKYNGDYYAYRCVRNLGIPLNEPDQVPQDLVVVDNEGDGSCTIDMGRMNPKARRTSRATGSLPAHTEVDPENRPYTKFEVLKDAYPEDRIKVTNGGWTLLGETEARWEWTNRHDVQYYLDPRHNPCPSGYRVPNQRELLIMTTRMTDTSLWPTYEATGTYWSWGSQ